MIADSELAGSFDDPQSILVVVAALVVGFLPSNWSLSVSVLRYLSLA